MNKVLSLFRGLMMKKSKKPDPDEPLYDDIRKPRCPRCNGPMIEVNARTGKLACANSMCRR